jgi:hypothetical protein
MNFPLFSRCSRSFSFYLLLIIACGLSFFVPFARKLAQAIDWHTLSP